MFTSGRFFPGVDFWDEALASDAAANFATLAKFFLPLPMPAFRHTFLRVLPLVIFAEIS